MAATLHAAKLSHLVGALDALHGPAEATFLEIGDNLAEALALLHRLETDFAGLTARLDAGDGAAKAGQALAEAVAQCAGLVGNTAGGLGLLRQLENHGQAAERPLVALTKIVDEIAALAINAKIQASHVAAKDVDFSVFTTEIARLGNLASQVVGRAAERLAALRLAIGQAKSAQERFETSDAGELGAIRGRLETCLDSLSTRQRRAQDAATVVRSKAQRVGERVAACIADLQINDMTSQRIEHVRHAIELLGGLLDPQATPAEGTDWAKGLDATRRDALVAAVCRLQAEQLKRAGADFGQAVATLKQNLDQLARDANEVLAQAVGLLGSSGNKVGFVGELEQNVGRAAALLSGYAQSEKRVQSLIAAVSEGFTAIAGDLEAIHSIDADLRIMGLNASLKCGRLGQSGVALGVVAQELRACSRRTEENTDAISQSIAAARDASQSLASATAAEGRGVDVLTADMAQSVQALRELERDLEAALARLGEASQRAATLLTETAARIDIDRRMRTAMETAAVDLLTIADSTEAPESLAAAIRDDVRHLLAKHYTMASERIIHQLFAEAGAESTGAQAGPADEDVCFF
jgi:hypothetical protein